MHRKHHKNLVVHLGAKEKARVAECEKCGIQFLRDEIDCARGSTG